MLWHALLSKESHCRWLSFGWQYLKAGTAFQSAANVFFPWLFSAQTLIGNTGHVLSPYHYSLLPDCESRDERRCWSRDHRLVPCKSAVIDLSSSRVLCEIFASCEWIVFPSLYSEKLMSEQKSMSERRWVTTCRPATLTATFLKQLHPEILFYVFLIFNWIREIEKHF